MRKYWVDESYFDKWSPDMAYILGYFYGDGSLSRQMNRSGSYSYKVMFYGAAKDSDKVLLRTIRDKLSCNAPLEEWSGEVRFRFTSEVMYKRLRSLGKGYELVYPEVPLQFERDFIRGYLDADGFVGDTIRLRTLKISTGEVRRHIYNPFVIKFGNTPQKKFLTVLESRIRNYGFAAHTISRGGKNSWHFSLSHAPALKLFKLLYVGAGLFLGRKGNGLLKQLGFCLQ